MDFKDSQDFEVFYNRFSKEFDKTIDEGKELCSFKSKDALTIYFDRIQLACAVDSMAKIRFINSYQILMDFFQDWKKKAKNENQIKTLSIAETALLDMFFFNLTLETNIKDAIANRYDSEDQLLLYKRKSLELAKELKNVKKEIEFISTYNK